MHCWITSYYAHPDRLLDEEKFAAALPTKSFTTSFVNPCSLLEKKNGWWFCVQFGLYLAKSFKQCFFIFCTDWALIANFWFLKFCFWFLKWKYSRLHSISEQRQPFAQLLKQLWRGNDDSTLANSLTGATTTTTATLFAPLNSLIALLQ